MKKILLFILLSFGSASLLAQTNHFKRTEDVIYGRKFGTALTLDIFQPEKPNGCGIVFIISGGWYSAHEIILPPLYEPFVTRGYTVFAVVHGSQPKFQIPEIIQDLHRAVRFIRFNGKKYGIDPNRIGVSGGSAGGHLALMLATHGGPGASDAKDPIDRESNAVQCVACFFPPTDFVNYGKPGESALGEGVLAPWKSAFGEIPKTTEAKQKFGREISPIYSITSNLPPTLIFQGDADKLVPIQQAESFVKRAEEAGATAKLIVKKGEGHGWKTWASDFAVLVDWFDQHLRDAKPAKQPSSK
ncbi:MAG: alpha/beta hydrolase [Verrucomicrobiota bacterium]|nr:alpha/beta hydrolase [Verrucomicrobiota bacterium]